MTLISWCFSVNQKHKTWTMKSETRVNDLFDLVLFSELKTYKTNSKSDTQRSLLWSNSFWWTKNIQNKHWSLIPELMTLMIQLFLVNQKYTTWTPKSDTQVNDSWYLAFHWATVGSVNYASDCRRLPIFPHKLNKCYIFAKTFGKSGMHRVRSTWHSTLISMAQALVLLK